LRCKGRVLFVITKLFDRFFEKYFQDTIHKEKAPD